MSNFVFPFPARRVTDLRCKSLRIVADTVKPPFKVSFDNSKFGH